MNITGMFLCKRYNGIWYVAYTEGGRRRWKSTKSRRKHEALFFLTDFKEAIKPKPRRIILSEFQKEFEEIEGPNMRESTLKGFYAQSFKVFISVCGDRELSSYTPRDVDLFKARRLKTCAPSTVNIDFRTLKAAFNCAVRWELIKENPFMKCSPLRVPQKLPTNLSEVEFAKLYNATTMPVFKNMFEFAVLTGMRLGEILSLGWAGVDFEKRIIRILNTEDFLTKTGKTRAVPMSNRVFTLLSNLRVESESTTFVFELNGRKVSKSYVEHRFREYRKAAEIREGVSFHSLRHTFATWLVQKGVSIYEVQKLLGHSDIKVTQIYSHLAASDLHDAVNKIRFEISSEDHNQQPSDEETHPSRHR